MAYRFNSTTATWKAADLGRVSVVLNDDSATQDISTSSSTTHIHVVGLTSQSVVVEHNGCPNATFADTGALAIGWNPGGTRGTLAAAVVTGIQCSGRVDEKITSSITFRPARA
jgi:hypothetical protein